MKFDWVLTTFDTDRADAALVQVSRDEPWDTIGIVAAQRGADMVFGTFPALTQLLPRFLAATSKAKIPSTSLPPAQLKALPALLSQLPIGGIVLPQRELGRAVAALGDTLYKGYFHVLLGPDEKPVADFPNLSLVFEVQKHLGVSGTLL